MTKYTIKYPDKSMNYNAFTIYIPLTTKWIFFSTSSLILQFLLRFLLRFS